MTQLKVTLTGYTGFVLMTIETDCPQEIEREIIRLYAELHNCESVRVYSKGGTNMTKTKDDYLVDAILCHKELAEQGKALALTQDTIRIALKTAGYQNVDSMNQFERASALLDMAQELAALTDTRKHYESVFDKMGREIANVRKRGEAHGGQ